MICLNEEMEKKTEFLDLMNTLLLQTKSVEEKKHELEEKFHINMESKMEKELNLMCNLSDLVEEEGIQKGINGMLRGLKDAGYTIEEACERVLEIFHKTQEEIREFAEKVWSETNGM